MTPSFAKFYETYPVKIRGEMGGNIERPESAYPILQHGKLHGFNTLTYSITG